MAQQTTTAAPANAPAAGGQFFDNMALWLIIGATIGVALATFFIMVRVFSLMTVLQQKYIYKSKGLEYMLDQPAEAATETWWDRFMRKIQDKVPLEKEKDIMLEHGHDGIRELDNNLPPWWVAMFYATIIFAVIYLFYYHVGGYGLNEIGEYKKEMADAQKSVNAYLATQAENVDENNVTALTTQADLDAGATIFKTTCVACHGQKGEGNVGPNFTDDYWIHGGGIKNIFKTIKYGVPEKGMISWKEQLKATEIQKVASYILTLHGTNPPNPKAPQGTIWTETAAAPASPADTTKTDTVKAAATGTK